MDVYDYYVIRPGAHVVPDSAISQVRLPRPAVDADVAAVRTVVPLAAAAMAQFTQAMGMWLILLEGVLNCAQTLQDTMNQMVAYTAGQNARWFQIIRAQF